MLSFIHWLENHMMPCFYKQIIGIDCPGCGMQRSLIELMKGNFVVSFKLYPALLFVMITLSITALHLILKLKNGARIIQYSFIATSGVILINYLIKFMPFPNIF